MFIYFTLTYVVNPYSIIILIYNKNKFGKVHVTCRHVSFVQVFQMCNELCVCENFIWYLLIYNKLFIS